MDQKGYNQQAVNWRTLKTGSEIGTLVYSIPLTDVMHYTADAVQDTDPWYTENSSYGRPIVPPGYFYGQYINLLVMPNYPMGVLNSQLTYESKGPIFVGEQVKVIGKIDRMYEKRGRPYMEIGMTITKSDGRMAGRALVTILLSLEG